MRKRLALVLATILACAFLFAGCANIGNNVSDVKYKVVDNHAEVIALPNGSNDSDITIADEYEGVPVTVINDFAGCNLESATIIHIGKNIETISEWAFSNNQKLTAYDIDEENESYCTIDGAIFTKDMTKICFYPCNGKTEFVIPDSVTVVAPRAFYKNENLESIKLSNSLEEIGEMAFFQCNKIENFDLPSTLKVIKKDAFTRCTALTKIEIPSSIEVIETYAFYNCTEAKTVVVNKSKDDIKLGKQWYPTNNGIEMDDLEIEWK